MGRGEVGHTVEPINVIASEAKQSILSLLDEMDYFAFARNDVEEGRIGPLQIISPHHGFRPATFDDLPATVPLISAPSTAGLPSRNRGLCVAA
jgi:hypothetical protein